MALNAGIAAVGRKVRWARTRACERSAHARMMRKRKQLLYAQRAHAKCGHFKYMVLCREYARMWNCKLTPASRAWIKAKHAAEIAASIKPLKRDRIPPPVSKADK